MTDVLTLVCICVVQVRAEGELNALEAQMRLQEEAHDRELEDRLTEKLALDKVSMARHIKLYSIVYHHAALWCMLVCTVDNCIKQRC
jgi:hypothetical protein